MTLFLRQDNILCLSYGFIALRRHHDHNNSYKENISLGLVCSFRGLVHYPRGGERGGLQTDMVLEKYLRIADPKAERRQSLRLQQTLSVELP